MSLNKIMRASQCFQQITHRETQENPTASGGQEKEQSDTDLS